MRGNPRRMMRSRGGYHPPAVRTAGAAGEVCANSIEGNDVTFFSVKESNQRNAGGLRSPRTPTLPRASAYQTSQALLATTSFWSLSSGKELPRVNAPVLRSKIFVAVGDKKAGIRHPALPDEWSLIGLVPGGGYSVYAAIAFRGSLAAGWKSVPQRCRKEDSLIIEEISVLFLSGFQGPRVGT